ncbi:MAG: CHAD domain-containing protein [Solirubrobacterales bacterium]|nr:CHAD domain-containing protein [Solirubrobacterales bacterium]
MKARPVKKLDPAGPLGENAARIIQVRVEELRSFDPKTLDPGAIETQHDMRIAAKRLRYVLETTGFCFGRPADTARRRARDLQDILGEMHDCDVMLPRVLEHLAELRERDAVAVRARAGNAPDLDPRLAAGAPHRTSYRGLEVLATYLKARRLLLFDRFVAYWQRQEETGTWARLERAVSNYVENARLARRAAKRAERAQAKLEAADQARTNAAARAARAREEQERTRRAATPRPARRPR